MGSPRCPVYTNLASPNYPGRALFTYAWPFIVKYSLLILEGHIRRSRFTGGSERSLDGWSFQRTRIYAHVSMHVVRSGEKVGTTGGRQIDDHHLEPFFEKERGPSRLPVWLGCLDLL